MPLTAPSNITISRLYRGFGAGQVIDTPRGKVGFGPASFSVYGRVRWTNTESGPHAVVLSVAGRETLLARGATEAKNVLLARYTVPDVSVKTVTIVVSLRLANETASVSGSFSVNGAQAAAFADSLQVSGNSLLTPSWAGAINPQGGSRFGMILNPIDGLNLTLSLGNSSTVGIVDSMDDETPLGGLIQGQAYRATLTASSSVTVKTDSYLFKEREQYFEERVYDSVFRWRPAQYRTVQSYLQSGTITRELYFEAPAPVIPFVAQGRTLRGARNVGLRQRLEANYRSTWAISSGNPGGFGIEYVPAIFGSAGPDEAYLVGTPLTSGSFTIGLTATRVDAEQTATATINLTVVDSLPKTVVTTNASIAREGLVTSTSDVVNIAFQSTPSPATWAATGLPPGVIINEEGTISGVPTKPGVFIASVTAKAADFEVSLPTTIKFTVGLGDTSIVGDQAALRSPWLLQQWELTDIHIAARTRVVESTMMEDGVLRLKVGDAADFAVFFVDTNNEVFALEPSELRLTIRKADNLDERIVYKSVAPPQSATQEGQTYYLLSVTTSNRERETVLEWAEENGKNEPLQCVADVDWVKNDKQYSSRSFPVLLELDVTRP